MRRGWFLVFLGLIWITQCLGSRMIAADPPLPEGAVPLPGHKDVVYSAARDPGGKTLVTACFDKSLRVWDAARGTLIRELGGPGGSQGIILGVDISPDGKWVAAVGMDQTLRLWENPRLDPTRVMNLGGGVAAALQGSDAPVRIFITSQGEWKQYKVPAPGQPAGSVSVTPFGESSGFPRPRGNPVKWIRLGNQHLALATDQGEIVLADSRGKWLKTWLAQESPISQMEIGWDGLVTIDPAGQLKSWKIDGAQIKNWPGLAKGAPARFLGQDADKVLLLPARGQSGLAQWRRLPDGQPLHELTGSETVLEGAAGQGPEGPLAALILGESVWGAWSGNHKEEKLRLRAPGAVRSLALGGGGKILVAVDGLGVQKWQAPVGEPAKPVTLDKPSEKAVIQADGRRVLLFGQDGRLRSLEGVIPRVDREVSRPGNQSCATLSPDGLEFLSGLTDGSLTWNRRATGDTWQPGFKAHDQAVAGVMWHPTGRLLSWDGQGRIKAWKLPWDAGFKAGEPLTKITLPDSPGFSGPALKGILETEEGLLLRRDQGGWQWLRFKDNVLGTVPAGPGGDWVQVAVHGRRLFVLTRDGMAHTLPDYRGDQPWATLAGGLADAQPLGVSMSHADRAIVLSRRGNDHFADLFDLKDLSLVGSYGPWPDLRAAIVIPFSNKILTLRSSTAQFHWAHFEGRLPGLTAIDHLAGGGNSLLALGRDRRLVHLDLAENPPRSRDLAFGVQGPVALSPTGKLAGWWTDQKWVMGELRTEVIPVSVPMAQPPRSARFDLEEKRLAVCDASQRAILVDVATGAFLEGASPTVPIHDCLPLQPHLGWVLSQDKSISLTPYALARRMALPRETVALGVQGSPGPWVLNREGEIRNVSPQDGKPDRSIARFPGGISLAQSPHQPVLAVASPTEVRLLGVEGKELAVWAGGGTIKTVWFHPQRNWLVIEGDTWAGVFDLSRLTSATKDEAPLRQLGRVVLPAVRGPLCFVGQQDQALLIPTPEGLLTWTIAQDQTIKSIAHPQGIDSVAFDPKNRFIATGCRDFKVRLWNPETGAMVREIPLSSKPRPGSSPLYALAFRPDGGQLAVAGIDRAVRVYDPSNGQLVREFPGVADGPRTTAGPTNGHEDSVFALAWSPDGQWLASAGVDRSIRIWKPADGQLVKVLSDPQLKPERAGVAPRAHPGWIHSLRFVDKETLVSAGAGPKGSGVIRLWKLPGGSLDSSFQLAQGPIQHVLLLDGLNHAFVATGQRTRHGEVEETLSFLAPWPFPQSWKSLNQREIRTRNGAKP